MIDLKNSLVDKKMFDYSFVEHLTEPKNFYTEKPNDKKYSIFFKIEQSEKITISLLLEKLKFYKYKYQTNFISLKFF